MKYSYWSLEEDEIIINNYPKGGAINCKALLPSRTIGAITMRANKLGVKKSSGISREKKPKVKDNLSYLSKLVEKEILYIPIEHYINSSTNINHKCNICEYIWKVSPTNILKGRGCPNCAIEKSKKHPGGYNITRFSNDEELANSKGICYLIVLIDKSTNTRTCLKIGITKGTSNKDVIKRIASIKEYEARILKTHSGTLKEVFLLEQALHNKWNHLKYSPEKKFAGHTECFKLDDIIIKTFPFIN